MTNTSTRSIQEIQVAIAWCLIDANQRNTTTLSALRNHFYEDETCGEVLQAIVTDVRELFNLNYPETIAQLQAYTEQFPILWEKSIGLVYGGATKIKPYVFDVPKLHEIRGASALLDNINLVDLPAFFQADKTPAEAEKKEDRFTPCRNAGSVYCDEVRHWLREPAQGYGALVEALIPELIIYSTGGNILAFCPPDLVDLLADAIEKRYTTETLTANSCAVGQAFKPLEIQFGLLPDTITADLFWIEKCQAQCQQQIEDKTSERYQEVELVRAYIKVRKEVTSSEAIKKAFKARKSFNELVSKLAILFNQRRAGNVTAGRSTIRRYPPLIETHPYLRRDHTEKGLSVLQATGLPDAPWHSEASARKRIIGQYAKREQRPPFKQWYEGSSLKSRWRPNPEPESWVKRFEDYLQEEANAHMHSLYYGKNPPPKIFESQTLSEIGNASNVRKYVGYIYADGNNMGGYIQGITTPEAYRQFSEDISKTTEESVYEALAQHLTIHRIQGMTDPERYHNDNDWVHPFEIIAIGGDDVFLIVPADKALQIAQTIGEAFERKLLEPQKEEKYQVKSEHPNDFRPTHLIHRYQPEKASSAMSQLSMSIGVLITSEDTPIAYAESLTEQLLKSAKEKAKYLKQPCEHDGMTYHTGYHGGTIDFQVLKSVTMISSKISEFRKDGLVKTYEDSKARAGEKPKDLHLYATPYTLHEIKGLLTLIQELKAVEFPKSQLYQIRSFLEKGKRTAILNYRYFRVRLKQRPNDLQKPLIDLFEASWCEAKENDGNIAPWMYYTELPDPTRPPKDELKSYYETIWRELVDLYEFIPAREGASDRSETPENAVEGVR
jgi:CRISPR-associated protein Cmr2